jgi:hypothetical protein
MARRIINVGIRFEITNLEQITDCKSADSKFDIANIEQLVRRVKSDYKSRDSRSTLQMSNRNVRLAIRHLQCRIRLVGFVIRQF